MMNFAFCIVTKDEIVKDMESTLSKIQMDSGKTFSANTLLLYFVVDGLCSGSQKGSERFL